MVSDAIGISGGNQIEQRPGWIKVWWVAARTFALPASIAPVLFGTAAAVVLGGAEFHVWRFLAALVAMALLHTGANLLNDVVDFRKGLDRMANPGSGAVVRGWITPAQAALAAGLLFTVGCAIGLVLVSLAGMALFWIGLAGVLLGVFYSLGPVWLKARALGDLTVMASFGVLGALGAWTVQTGSADAWPALWAVPVGLHVAGILHANNWRDMGHDVLGRVLTMARLLGERGAFFYYLGLIFLPYLLVSLFVVFSALGAMPFLPWTALLVVLSLPEAVRLARRAGRRHRQDPIFFLSLDAATARLNLIFGLLYTAGIVLWLFL